MVSSRPRCSSVETAFFAAKVCSGAGLLGVPFAFQKAGALTASLQVLIVAFLNYYCSNLLVACFRQFHRSELSGHGDSYGGLAFLALARSGPRLVNSAILLSLTGGTAVYFITIATLLNQVFPSIPSLWFVVVSVVFLSPTAFLRDLSSLSKVSILGIFTYGLAYAAIFYSAIGKPVEPAIAAVPDVSSLPVSFSSVFSYLFVAAETFGVFCFSFGVPIIALQLNEAMEKPELFSKAIGWSMIAVAAAYLFIGLAGLHFFEPHVQPIIISNLPEGGLLADGVKLLMCATLQLTAPLLISPALNLVESLLFPKHEQSLPSESSPLLEAPVSSIEDLLAKPARPSPNPRPEASESLRVSCRLCLIFLIALVSVGIPCFTLIVSLIGSISLCLLSFLFPPIFSLRLKTAGLATRLALYFLIGFGVCLMILSLKLIVNGKCE